MQQFVSDEYYLTDKSQLFRLSSTFSLCTWLTKKQHISLLRLRIRILHLHLLSGSHKSFPSLAANVSVSLNYKQHMHVASETYLCLRSVKQ